MISRAVVRRVCEVLEPTVAAGWHVPTCGAPLEGPPPAERPSAPWHFKLLLVALVLYLGYRAYQGVFWLAHHV